MSALKSTVRSLALFLAGILCVYGYQASERTIMLWHAASSCSAVQAMLARRDVAQAELPTPLVDWMEAVRQTDTDPLPPPTPESGR